MVVKRTALLIRCTEDEARQIREKAKLERRTISGFVLHAVMSRITSQSRALETYYSQSQARMKSHTSARAAQQATS